MLGNSWKCILNCASWFISFILNFNALCNACTVHRHTKLLRSNRIFCLISGKFGNYFFTVYNEIADHLWQYFAYFLNHNLSMKKFIVKFFLTDFQII